MPISLIPTQHSRKLLNIHLDKSSIMLNHSNLDHSLSETKVNCRV